MANSGSVLTNTLKNTNFYVDWQVATESISDNYHDINWQTGINANNDYWYSNAVKINNISINGATVFNGGTYSNIIGGRHQLASGTTRIYHNNDGNKNFNITISGWLYSFGNCSGSANFDLPYIARYSKIISAPNFNDEENPTITFTNPSNGIFDLKVKMEVNGNTAFITRNLANTATSCTIELTDAERTRLRNATLNSNNLAVRFTVCSMNGNEELSWSYLDKTMSIVNAMPEITVSAKDVGVGSTILTGDENTIIKGFNYIIASMSSSLKKGATIKSQTILCGDKILIGDVGGTASMEGGFDSVETNTIAFGLTDSRGNTVNKYITLDMVDYIKLTCNLKANNPTADGKIALNISGNYFKGSFGAVENTLSVQFRYKENDGEFTEWIDADITPSDNIYDLTINLTGFNYKSAYTFQARALDGVNPNGVLSTEKKVKTIPVYDWGENDFNINGILKINDVSIFDLIYPVGAIYMSTINVNPSTLFGGTWEAWGTGRVPVGVDTTQTEFNTVEKTGGSKTHTLTLEEMPEHKHTLASNVGGGSGSINGFNWGLSISDWGGKNTLNAGGSKAHNILQPYITCYMWKRTE